MNNEMLKAIWIDYDLDCYNSIPSSIKYDSYRYMSLDEFRIITVGAVWKYEFNTFRIIKKCNF